MSVFSSLFNVLYEPFCLSLASVLPCFLVSSTSLDAPFVIIVQRLGEKKLIGQIVDTIPIFLTIHKLVTIRSTR